MLINQEVIVKFNPCQDRFDNFKTNYPGFNGELGKFLSLDKITYRDKVWVSMRLMTRTQKVKFAIKCAESTLHIFESKNPNDKRPRECIDYLKTYESFENLTQEQRDQIWKARCFAAAYAADAAYAAYAADAYAYAAADAADAAYARKIQEDKNLQFVLEVLCLE